MSEDAPKKSPVPFTSLLAFGTCITAVFTCITLYPKEIFILDLLSHFRTQYFAFGLFATIFFAAIRKPWWALTACFVFITNLYVIAPTYVSKKTLHTSNALRHTALLANVNTGNTRFLDVATVFREIDPDILVVQETNQRWINALQEFTQDYSYRRTIPRPDNFGIAVYSKLKIENLSTVYFAPKGPPSIVGELLSKGSRAEFIASHPVPPVGEEYFRMRNDQLRGLAAFLTHNPTSFILLGDLNTTPWSETYRRFIAETSGISVRDGIGILPTWPQNNVPMEWLFSIPIDHGIVSSDIEVFSTKTVAIPGSDHRGLLVTFSLGS